MQNELQNAYAVSNMEHNESQAAAHAAIAAVVASGLVAVVRKDVAFCPSTDAALRHRHVTLLAALPSYGEAESFLHGVSGDPEDYDGETNFMLECLPELVPARPALAGKTIFGDGLPF
jgi:hypothetical protein